MLNISKLPNYYNGKLYKRWNSIRNFYGNGSIIASKNDGKKGITQLFITDDGKKRELFIKNGKIIDSIDPDGIKRVYTYEKQNNDVIIGKMFAHNSKNGTIPLIASAQWILRKMRPEQILLKFTPKHPDAKVFIKQILQGQKYNTKNRTTVISGVCKSKEVIVSDLLAKDFDNSYYSLPKTYVFTTNHGEKITITGISGKGNFQLAKRFEIESDILGKNFRTIV